MTDKQNYDIQKQISFVSHEIRNNLSICDMYSQIIKRKLESLDSNDNSLENAVCCIQTSLQLISANLTELKAIGQNLPVICDLKKIILDSTELSKAYIAEKDIKFDIDIKDNANIRIDKNKFTSCLINILKNAIEAIKSKGNIKILVEINKKNVIIKISNDGNPIPKDIQGNIFNYAYTTKETGSGYGLCLCKKYLEEQYAQIKLLKSDKSETVFEITITIVE